MTDDAAFHIRIAEEIEARAAAIIALVESGEKNRSMLRTARAHLADAARIRAVAASC